MDKRTDGRTGCNSNAIMRYYAALPVTAA